MLPNLPLTLINHIQWAMQYWQHCWQFFITNYISLQLNSRTILSENEQPQLLGPEQKLKRVFATPLPEPTDVWKLARKAPGLSPAAYCQERKDTPLWLSSVETRSLLNCCHLSVFCLFVCFISPLQSDNKTELDTLSIQAKVRINLSHGWQKMWTREWLHSPSEVK